MGPKAWSDVVDAAAGGLLDESHWVDLKLEFPAGKRTHNTELAQDLACLFDMTADPLELRNRAGDPALAGVRSARHDELLRGLDVERLKERILRSQRDRLLTVAGTPADSPGNCGCRGTLPACVRACHRDTE